MCVCKGKNKMRAQNSKKKHSFFRSFVRRNSIYIHVYGSYLKLKQHGYSIAVNVQKEIDIVLWKVACVLSLFYFRCLVQLVKKNERTNHRNHALEFVIFRIEFFSYFCIFIEKFPRLLVKINRDFFVKYKYVFYWR